jgi:RHS repeat-associated protein
VDQTTSYGYTGTQQTSKAVKDNAAKVVTQSTTFRYDLQGEMSDVRIDTFDATGVSTGREEVGYEYGPDGIRVAALDSGTRTEFLIDTRNDTGYEQVLQETVRDAGNGAEVRRAVYTIGLAHIAQTTFTPSGPAGGETLVFHSDGHDSTRVLTDLAAAVATVAGARQVFHYDAYGNAVGFSPSAAATAYLYSGEHLDTRILQQYLRARYYNPATGQFLTQDPVQGDIVHPTTLQKYVYTSANPVNDVDPTGKFFLLDALINAGRDISARIVIAAQSAYAIGNAVLIRAFYWYFTNALKIEFYATVASLGLGLASAGLQWMDEASERLLMTPIPDNLATEADIGERWMEPTAGANATHYRAIDDFRNGHVTALKSIGTDNMNRLINRIDGWADQISSPNRNYQPANNAPAGTPPILAGQVSSRGLIVGIAESSATFLRNPAFRSAVLRIQTATRVAIRVVPIRG